jgi:hypothetical protein
LSNGKNRDKERVIMHCDNFNMEVSICIYMCVQKHRWQVLNSD